MSLTRKQLIIISIGIALVILLVLVFVFGSRESNNAPQVTLRVFGLDDERTFELLTAAYTQQFPNVTFEYTNFSENTYERDLISALAAGSGPDLLYFHNRWLPKHGDKILAAPPEMGISAATVAQAYPNVIEQDFTKDGLAYGVPLYLDTLALFYNKDIFDAHAIALPPTAWNDVEKILPQFRVLNQQGQLTTPAITLGGSNRSIPAAPDILSLLMMQFGSSMIERGTVRFNNQGQQAFNYYLSFSNPANTNYAWNDSFHAQQSFINGNLAMTFGYARDLESIQNQNAFLRVGVVPMIQRAGTAQPINYANYWGLAVSRQSPQAAWAWHFLATLMGDNFAARQYLETTKRPPARRVLINEYLNDAQLGVFARQALTARSWEQPDNNEVSRILSETIQTVINGTSPARNALEEAQKQINNL